MPAPSAPINHLDGGAPPPGPLAPFRRTEDSLTLGVADLGSITVDARAITVRGPDEESRGAVWDRLGVWAEAQWYARHGFMVIRGAAVAREGRGVVLAARSQQGASITAAQMTDLGWGIVSDGIVVLGQDGTLLSRRPLVHLDSEAAERLYPLAPRVPLAAGRPRTAVELPSHDDAGLADVVLMSVDNSVGSVVVTGPTMVDASAGSIPLVRSLLTPQSLVAPPSARIWVVVRPMPVDEAMMARVRPPMVAQHLDAALADAAASRTGSR